MNISLAAQYYSPSGYNAADNTDGENKPLQRLNGLNVNGENNNAENTARNWFIKLLQGQRQGRGCLPLYLGLTQTDFAKITAQLGVDLNAVTQVQSSCEQKGIEQKGIEQKEIEQKSIEKGALRQDLMDLRIGEWEELRNLVGAYSHTRQVEEFKLPDIIAAGCLGGDHLWRDLGFLNRAELSEFMQHNFPMLAALNSKDMKWKKFFYKQLCEQEGGYVCRSPSCEACTAYDDCFGSED